MKSPIGCTYFLPFGAVNSISNPDILEVAVLWYLVVILGILIIGTDKACVVKLEVIIEFLRTRDEEIFKYWRRDGTTALKGTAVRRGYIEGKDKGGGGLRY